ncbi:MAG: hypothetical protein L0338_38895 [Acidobacteria bacterium]|nr:hypothetical protein [Acidobacteriota bacterium]
MFGKMNVVPVVDLRGAPEDVGGSLDAAVARLLAVTEHPAIEKWVQFPRALLVFLVIPGDAESGAFYIYDRRSRVWFWVDFEDEKFGGYGVNDFERLVRECKFLDIVERPHLLCGQRPWIVQPGSRPGQVCASPDPTCKLPA